MKIWNQWKYLQDIQLLILTPTRSCRETCCDFRTTSWTPQIIQTVLRRWFEDCWIRTILHFSRWRRRTRCSEESMSRAYFTSKRRSIPSERLDSQKHENRPGLGCEGLPSSITLRYRNHGRILVSRQNSFLGLNSEWNWQICNRNVRNHFTWKRWAQSHRDTFCESKTTTKAFYDTVLPFLFLFMKETG